MFDLVLKNLKLVGESGEFYIAIQDGKIAKMSKTPISADNEMDIKGQYVLPGLIDPHVHFRDPGLTYKEDFKTGSMAAANGGFTFVMDMPNTLPKTNTYKAFKDKLEMANSKSVVNFGLHSGHSSFEEMERILELNPMSFKVFMDLESDERLREIFKNISNLDGNPILTVHAEKQSIVRENTERLSEDLELKDKPISYSYARSAESEIESISQTISLSKEFGNNLHICHLSTKKGMELAKENNISYEFTPHHLLFDNSYFDKFGTIVKTNPPLRESKDKVNVSDIDSDSMIGTDHAPHSLEEKNKGVWDSSPGIPSLETVLSLLLTEVNKSNLDFNLIPKIFAENPAKRFNLKNKGFIKENYDADFVVVDLNKEGTFNIDEFYTKAEYSPFDGMDYQGAATMTIIGGEVIMEDNELFI
ncbi:dihydroorotase PyrC [Methanobrevibacter ruminantium M1]|uniref:Dihydroorotase n=1 Tax=Methanobrevibacter ruminantium (strain ATCC 35063 / DSM 1093 / JCM 13430 / OCM 146 / M1) TaxID=634498 RepID=D3DZS6_METRM|nr:dihydroorotase family protein [Methanobrevibacter ruminantium]ADC47754.1 dihydroorotase PyrC [Methanobrevibacter ruminantium M1]